MHGKEIIWTLLIIQKIVLKICYHHLYVNFGIHFYIFHIRMFRVNFWIITFFSILSIFWFLVQIRNFHIFLLLLRCCLGFPLQNRIPRDSCVCAFGIVSYYLPLLLSPLLNQIRHLMLHLI